MGSTATVVVGQVLSAAFITVVLLATGSSIGRLRDIMWLVLLNGVFTAVAYATHYHALQPGPSRWYRR